MADLIDDTFATLRATAKRRGGRVPDLRRQGTGVVPRRSRFAALKEAAAVTVPGLDLGVEKRERGPAVGRASGPDGRAPRRGYRVAGFGTLVRREIRQREWSENLALGWVMGNWAGLVGEKIAQHTEVQMIKDGEVFVVCDQTAWATQLKYMQATVLSAIADKVGPGVITKLRVYPPKTKNWRKGPLHVKGRGPRDTYG